MTVRKALRKGLVDGLLLHRWAAKKIDPGLAFHTETSQKIMRGDLLVGVYKTGWFCLSFLFLSYFGLLTMNYDSKVIGWFIAVIFACLVGGIGFGLTVESVCLREEFLDDLRRLRREFNLGDKGELNLETAKNTAQDELMMLVFQIINAEAVMNNLKTSLDDREFASAGRGRLKFRMEMLYDLFRRFGLTREKGYYYDQAEKKLRPTQA